MIENYITISFTLYKCDLINLSIESVDGINATFF